MGGQRKLEYEHVFLAPTKEEVIETMIKREIGELMYLPLLGLLERMRKRLGFRSLAKTYDQKVHELSLVRNCLLHNQGKVSPKLAKFSVEYKLGERIVNSRSDVDTAIATLRRLAYQIDKTLESKSQSENKGAGI